MNRKATTIITTAAIAGIGLAGIASANAQPTTTTLAPLPSATAPVAVAPTDDTAAITSAVTEEMRNDAAVAEYTAAIAATMRAEAEAQAAAEAEIAAMQASAAAAEATSTASSAGSASGDVAAWAASDKAMSVKFCESTNNYSTNTGNGYYGAWQFDIPSWIANGGGAYASRPDLAPSWAQDQVAYNYYQVAGWGPWECA